MTTASPVMWSSPYTMARPKPCGPGFCTGASVGNPRLQALRESPTSRSRAAVVDDDDLVRDAVEAQLDVQVLDRRGDAALLVARRNDDRQLARAAASAGSGRCAVGMVLGVPGECRASRDARVRARGSPRGCRRWSATAPSPRCRGRAMHRAPSRGCRTGAPRATGSTGWSPRRSRHQALSCASDRADWTPPPTFTIARRRRRSLRRDLPSISGTRSAGCRQSRTWWPVPPKPM